MAGKGGGSWKVAYADFVTAMMAFFMVMWIIRESKPVKQAIAQYFNYPWRTSSKPTGDGPGGSVDRAGQQDGEASAALEKAAKPGLPSGGDWARPYLCLHGFAVSNTVSSEKKDPEAVVVNRPSLFFVHSKGQPLCGHHRLVPRRIRANGMRPVRTG